MPLQVPESLKYKADRAAREYECQCFACSELIVPLVPTLDRLHPQQLSISSVSEQSWCVCAEADDGDVNQGDAHLLLFPQQGGNQKSDRHQRRQLEGSRSRRVAPSM